MPVTPVSAIGANFGFELDHPSETALNTFRLADLNSLAGVGLEIADTRIVRKIPYLGRDLNLTLRLADDGKITVLANYHKDVPNAESAKDAIGGAVIGLRNHIHSLVAELYDTLGGA